MLRMVATDSRRARTRPDQVAGQKRDAGAFDRDIGAAAHGDADIGRGQRRRVIDAVADHGDAAAFAAKPLHHLALALRQHAGLDLVDAERSGHRARGGEIVAGQHHDAQAVVAQRPQRRLTPRP